MASSLLNQKLSSRFSQFHELTLSDMTEVLKHQDDLNHSKLESEKSRLQEIINEKDSNIESLNSQIQNMRALKKTRTNRLFSLFLQDQNKKNLTRSFNSWIKFHQEKFRQKKMATYVTNFYKRGIIKRNYRNWKNETRKVHHVNVNQATMKKIQNEVQTATRLANEETELLKLMVKELTEDLRNETIAKNSLKYKFEQALLRGMSALNMENMSIHQDIISQSRSFTQTSRALLYTPDKFGYLTRP